MHEQKWFGHTQYCHACRAAGKAVCWLDGAGMKRHNLREHHWINPPRGTGMKYRKLKRQGE